MDRNNNSGGRNYSKRGNNEKKQCILDIAHYIINYSKERIAVSLSSRECANCVSPMLQLLRVAFHLYRLVYYRTEHSGAGAASNIVPDIRTRAFICRYARSRALSLLWSVLK